MIDFMKEKPRLYVEYIEKLKSPHGWDIKSVTLNDEPLMVDNLEFDADYRSGSVSVKITLAGGAVLTIPDVYLEIKKLHVRPDWDQYFLDICKSVAARADCRRAQHGCIIVKDHRIISTGYNGSPSGGPSCLDGECPRGLLSNDECRSLSSYENCIALHAEQNAIAYADGLSTRDATLYVTGRQCDMCRKLTMAAGIKRVVWPEGEEVFE